MPTPSEVAKERERQRVKARKWYADPANRDKRLSYMKEHRLKNIDRYRARHRFWRSGWSAEEFDRAWRTQEGRCAICEVAMRALGRHGDSVTADHNHTTGRPRALLCRVCNSRLAAVEDFGWKQRAEQYLKRFPRTEAS